MSEPDRQPEPLLGPDGELIVPIRVPGPHPLRPLRLPLLIATAISLTLLGVGGAFIAVTTAPTPYMTPVDPYMPKEIAAHAMLYPRFGAIMGGNSEVFPCNTRHIHGHLDDAQPGTTVQVSDDSKALDLHIPVDALGNYALAISLPASVPIKVWVYSGTSQVLSGISNLRFGDSPAHSYCTLTIDFHRMPS